MLALLALVACFSTTEAPKVASPGPTPAEALAFVEQANSELKAVWVASSEAAWAFQTDITPAHEEAVAKAEALSMEKVAFFTKEAAKYRDVPGLTPDVARQITLLLRGSTLPAPSDKALREELAALGPELEGMYGAGKACDAQGQNCRNLLDLEAVLASAPAEKDAEKAWQDQLDAWTGWHGISVPMRPKYARFVELGNQGAKEVGYADLGSLWRSNYDMQPDAFAAEVDRLWTQVAPLYDQLHCYTRGKLAERYGVEKVPATGPIPAHVLGNMWAQSWENLYPVLVPFPKEAALDVNTPIKARWDKGELDAAGMTRIAEDFFVSLGMEKLPDTFWQRSMLTKPEGKEVVCHASAWDLDFAKDVRIKMCILPDADNVYTLHHELGHIYYDLAYHTLSPILQGGANDGFHEGIGDTLALSITPAYLQRIGLLEQASESEEGQINKLMSDALQKIAFLPFGRIVDEWRWKVFSGELPPERWNEGWWELRRKYQGVAPPLARSEADFDPGAKYHVPGNTPYMRYFLAHVLQFQFHEALCKAAGHQGPLHTCSIYDSPAAGEKLWAMMQLGASKPWPDALEAVAGTREMDAKAMVTYFQPLLTWLAKENEGKTCGW